MAINRQSNLDNFTRGSDTLWHQAHMIFAGIKRILIAGLVAAISVFFAFLMLVTNAKQREILGIHYTAALMSSLGIRHDVTLPLPTGDRKFSAKDAAEITQPAADKFGFLIFLDMCGSLFVGVYVGRLLWRFQTKKGKEESQDKHLRGQRIVDSAVLSTMTSKDAKLGFRIGGVPIPDHLLQRNFAFVGSPGTGKSRGIFDFLDVARPSMKAVVYDRTGGYVERYYDPSRGDVILNPFDLRCAQWTIFADLRSELDYSTIAHYFVQERKDESNPMFTDAARILFEDVMKLVQLEPGFKKTMREVARIATSMDLESLWELLKKHELPSAGTLNPSNPKTSESVRFSLAAQESIRFFKYFDEAQASFSIRDFIESDSKGWLFLLSHPEQHVAIRPFASAWLELAMLAAMGGQEIDYTRIVFAVDEFASLPKLRALETGMTEARKFGVSIILGFQNAAQVDAIWGQDLRKVLLSTAQTKIIFRTEEAETAKALADTLGKKEVDEASAGANFGVESAKDTNQISRKRTEVNLVMESEIMTLPGRTAYLKIAGDYPIARVTTPDVLDRKIAPAYEKRVLPALEMRYAEEAASPDVIEAEAEVKAPAPKIDMSGLWS